MGFVAVLQLMAALNISLAIINLLPIPVLDGGHILFLLVEKIRGRPASERVEDWATRLGLTLIGMLFIFVTYNDLVKFGARAWDNISRSTSKVWRQLHGEDNEAF